MEQDGIILKKQNKKKLKIKQTNKQTYEVENSRVCKLKRYEWFQKLPTSRKIQEC